MREKSAALFFRECISETLIISEVRITILLFIIHGSGNITVIADGSALAVLTPGR